MWGEASHIFGWHALDLQAALGLDGCWEPKKSVGQQKCVYFKEGNPKPSQTPLFTVFRQDPTRDTVYIYIWGSCPRIAGQHMDKLETNDKFSAVSSEISVLALQSPIFIQTLTVRVRRETLVLWLFGPQDNKVGSFQSYVLTGAKMWTLPAASNATVPWFWGAIMWKIGGIEVSVNESFVFFFVTGWGLS